MTTEMSNDEEKHANPNPSQDEEKTATLQSEGEALVKDIATLKDSVFAFHQTRCVGCGLPLELPVLHFLCGHSYHKNCVATQEKGCPKCGCAVTKTKPLSDEEFLKKVSVRGGDETKMVGCENGFAVVADCFAQHAFEEPEETEEEPIEPEVQATQPVEDIDEDAIPIQTLEL